MKKYILTILILIFVFFGCEKENNETVQPSWLQGMIDTIETNDCYWGSKIYRHEWKFEHYYHLEIPLSSCAFCNVYKKDGKSVDWQIENIEDYWKNRKNEQIIWEWKKAD